MYFITRTIHDRFTLDDNFYFYKVESIEKYCDNCDYKNDCEKESEYFGHGTYIMEDGDSFDFECEIEKIKNK